MEFTQILECPTESSLSCEQIDGKVRNHFTFFCVVLKWALDELCQMFSIHIQSSFDLKHMGLIVRKPDLFACK